MSDMVNAENILRELNEYLNQDFSVMEDDEMQDALEHVVRLLEHLVFNLVNYKIHNIRMVRSQAVKAIRSVREGKLTMSEDTLKSADRLAPLLSEVVNKLDILDEDKSMGSILLEVVG